MSELYKTQDQGLAAFLIYVLSTDAFDHVEITQGRPIIWFHDNIKDNTFTCTGLAKMYFEGAQLRSARDYSESWEWLASKIRRAFKDRKEAAARAGIVTRTVTR